MKIIAGLGNPTREYEHTRHNIGFDVVDRLAKQYNISITEKKHKGLCGKGLIEGERVLLLKPQTFMNLSGESIQAAVDFYKLDPEEDVIVIYDDIALDAGRIRVRGKGSAGGHNGMKNIIAHLGTQVFPRVRVGVGAKPADWDLVDYVLGQFPAEEQPVMEAAKDTACEAVVQIITQGVEKTMNARNGKQD